MEKYLNEAIIGNKNILATFTTKGELQRMYYPAKDNKQYINRITNIHLPIPFILPSLIAFSNCPSFKDITKPITK